MPTLGFKKQFAPPIQARRKLHTIRGKRLRPIKPGDKLYLYVGLRTRNCWKILPDPVICSRVEDIRFTIVPDDVAVTIDGRLLSALEREELAFADGFDGWVDMLNFWADRLGPDSPVWEGDIIHWRFA